MAITLAKQDCQDLALHYPELNCILSRGVIWGTLDFNCSFDFSRQELVFDDSSDCPIHDSYEIRIDFNQSDIFGFPKVFEESGIIRTFAEANKIKLKDLHVDKDDADSCCLGIFPEYQWKGAVAYIRDKVIPFYYWQSYRRIYGKEPWRGHSHGVEGIKESMTMPPSQSAKGCSRNKKCPCGSGRKYKKCCMRRDEILKSKLPKPKPARKSEYEYPSDQ